MSKIQIVKEKITLEKEELLNFVWEYLMFSTIKWFKPSSLSKDTITILNFLWVDPEKTKWYITWNCN